MLLDRRDELQLAPPPRPRARARLRRLARGLPPRRHGPLAALLGPRRAPRPELPRAQELAAPQRRRAGPPDDRGMIPRVAVVGHVEHVEFCVVDRLPDAGEIANA